MDSNIRLNEFIAMFTFNYQERRRDSPISFLRKLERETSTIRPAPTTHHVGFRFGQASKVFDFEFSIRHSLGSFELSIYLLRGDNSDSSYKLIRLASAFNCGSSVTVISNISTVCRLELANLSLQAAVARHMKQLLDLSLSVAVVCSTSYLSLDAPVRVLLFEEVVSFRFCLVGGKRTDAKGDQEQSIVVARCFPASFHARHHTLQMITKSQGRE